MMSRVAYSFPSIIPPCRAGRPFVSVFRHAPSAGCTIHSRTSVRTRWPCPGVWLAARTRSCTAGGISAPPAACSGGASRNQPTSPPPRPWWGSGGSGSGIQWVGLGTSVHTGPSQSYSDWLHQQYSRPYVGLVHKQSVYLCPHAQRSIMSLTPMGAVLIGLHFWVFIETDPPPRRASRNRTRSGRHRGAHNRR